MSTLWKKFSAVFFIVLSFSLLGHYFVLTYFKVNESESFLGKVEQIKNEKNGLFPAVIVKFKTVSKEDNKIIHKQVKFLKAEFDKFKIGKTYKIKTQNNWIVSIR